MNVVRWIFVSAAFLAAAAVLLCAGLFVALSLTDSPVFAWRVLRYNESDLQDYRIFPDRPIANAALPSPIPQGEGRVPTVIEYPYRGLPRKEIVDDLLKRTHTNAFIVIRDDKVIFEKYPGTSREAVNTSFSAAKSFVSALIGAAIADGSIGAVTDPVIKYVPEIAGRGLDDLTIRDLLLMNSGIAYRLNDDLPFYMHPLGDDALSYYAPDLRKIALAVRAGETPIGETFYYNNYHMLVEGLILERATGMHVASYLQERIWKPMGAEFPASWSLDSAASGFEKMESGINARAIDYARFGLVFLHGGAWNGNRILPEAWVRESTAPLRPDTRRWAIHGDVQAHGGYHKYHWWGLSDPRRGDDFYAHGKYDQIIYVAPRKNTVIVRLGERPDSAMSWPLAMQALVDAMP